jgi:hypothetical protein
MSKNKPKLPKKICLYCKYHGKTWKTDLDNMTYCHCDHPVWMLLHQIGNISGWDTLMTIFSTCEKFSPNLLYFNKKEKLIQEFNEEQKIKEMQTELFSSY